MLPPTKSEGGRWVKGNICAPRRLIDTGALRVNAEMESSSTMTQNSDDALTGGGLNDNGDQNTEVRELAEVPAVEVISRAAVMLMSSAAEKLGLSDPDPESSPHLDLDEARRVITALAGLVTASIEYLGPHAGPIREGLQALQRAFREASSHPDEPGKGPGEKYTGPVY